VTKRRAAFLGIAAPLVLAIVLLLVVPAAAHHKSGHENGGGNGNGNGKATKSSSGMTEDNDTNDGNTPNNVVDEGDNAHPSGKDKSVEHGNSGNQGNSQSDPDDDGRGPDRSNGGADKPDGPGGVDLADQDGNNGCGNDDDFEDDNEGWCGKKPKPERKVDSDGPKNDDDSTKDDDTTVDDDGATKDDDSTKDDDGKTCPDDTVMVGVVCEAISDVLDTNLESVDEVLGERIERSPTGLPETAIDASDEEVVAADRAERSSALPFTGSGVTKLLLVAGGLVVLGLLMLAARRKA
jgi:hypothetical protein